MSKGNWLAGAVSIASLLVLGWAALVPAPERSEAGVPPRDEMTLTDKVYVDLAYQAFTIEQMATQAGAILAGQVTHISPTRWNQDGGAYWEEVITDAEGLETIDSALPYYEIELAVSESIVDTLGLGAQIGAGKPVILTLIGMSPEQDPDTTGTEAVTAGKGPAFVRVGDTIVVFAQPTRMAWREGTRAILAPMGNPAQATVRIGSADPAADAVTDGSPMDDTATNMDQVALDEIKDEIAAARGASATE